ncbi:IL17C protein, partial [Polypterus senegalus]
MESKGLNIMGDGSPELRNSETKSANLQWRRRKLMGQQDDQKKSNTGNRMVLNAIFKRSFKINRQAGRFPETIMEAHCLCPGCLDLKRQTFTMDYVSVPITRKESVYYIEQCKNGKFRYNQAWIEVAVGCTCAAPRTVSSS